MQWGLESKYCFSNGKTVRYLLQRTFLFIGQIYSDPPPPPPKKERTKKKKKKCMFRPSL